LTGGRSPPSRGAVAQVAPASRLGTLLDDAQALPPAEARLALTTARRMLTQPMRPRQLVAALNVFGAIMPWGPAFRNVEGADVREVVLTALSQTVVERGYAGPVVEEALRRLRDGEQWMPAIATVVKACEEVRREMGRLFAECEGEIKRREAEAEREERRRERERDRPDWLRRRVAYLGDLLDELRTRRTEKVAKLAAARCGDDGDYELDEIDEEIEEHRRQLEARKADLAECEKSPK
jgi:hypothetical protein